MKEILRTVIGDDKVFHLKEFWYKHSRKYKQEVALRKSFYSKFVSSNDLCFDIGANIGNRSEVLIDLGADVIAIEPLDGCCNYMRRKYKGKLIVVNRGLSNKEGIEDFHISNSSVISSFSEEWIDSVKNTRFKNYRWPLTVKKEVITLDSLIRTYGVPKFIKIDVEGYELKVLQGLSVPINHISFEYNVPEKTLLVSHCLDRVNEIMTDIDYECNYSIGESMEYALERWITPESMKELIYGHEFIDSGFGDVYIRRLNIQD